MKHVCTACCNPATYIPDWPGGNTSCDEHISLIAAFNAVEERIAKLHYEHEDIPETLEEQYDALLTLIDDLRLSNDIAHEEGDK